MRYREEQNIINWEDITYTNQINKNDCVIL